MKGCSTSFTIREMKIITTVRYLFTPVRTAIINKSQTTSVGEVVEKREPYVLCGWECGLVQALWKTVWNFLRKLKTELPFAPAIPLLGLYPKNPETPIQKNLYTPMVIAALSTIAKCWKQPKCP